MLQSSLACAVLLSLAPAQTETPEPKRHPLAPSMRLLSDEEYARFDAVIERFILYDTGKLKGEAGRKALREFNALPKEAIFSLIDKFNKAANMQDSCPAVIIGRKIAKILYASNDVELLTFARENIGAGVTARRHKGVVGDLRVGAMIRKNRLVARYKNQMIPGQRLPLPLLTIKQLAKESERQKGVHRQKVFVELSKRDGKEVVDLLAFLALEKSPASKQLARTLLAHHAYRQPKSRLKAMLQDDRPSVRAATAHAIGLRKYPWVDDLIQLLDDSDSDVQQSARGALVRVTRGRVDFGPVPGASESERSTAVRQWREWRESLKR